MKFKDTGKLTSIILHKCSFQLAKIDSSRSNCSAVMQELRYFKSLTFRMKVRNIYDLSDGWRRNATCGLTKRMSRIRFYVQQFRSNCKKWKLRQLVMQNVGKGIDNLVIVRRP